jgi:hypothetical protein
LPDQLTKTKRASLAATTLDDKLVQRRSLQALQSMCSQKRKDPFVAQDEIEVGRDSFIAGIDAYITKGQEEEPLFRIRWSLI